MFGGGSGCTGFGAFCICKGFRTIFGFRVYSRDLGFQGLRARVLWERDFRFIGQDGKTSLETINPKPLNPKPQTLNPSIFLSRQAREFC